jgi:hypothetical protein
MLPCGRVTKETSCQQPRASLGPQVDEEETMKYAGVSVIYVTMLILLTMSCTGDAKPPELTGARSAEVTEYSGTRDAEPRLHAKETKRYAPGQVLVKFKDSTQQQTIEAIQTELRLETIRIISRPNLYLMKIQGGSSVEDIVKRLQEFRAVEYSEPNYVRTIQ